MANVFISYASEDRIRAQSLADAFSERGWSVWWDRKIPLGKSFDEVIEKALAEARCVIVLWSPHSVDSKWVRNEASEGERRGILVPVFLADVAAPLAFRLLNGANLTRWQRGTPDAEFDKLVERVTDLLGQTGDDGSNAVAADHGRAASRQPLPGALTGWLRFSKVIAGLGVFALSAVAAVYIFRGRQPETTTATALPAPGNATEKTATSPGASGDMEKAIKDLAGAFGGAVPATSLATGFHVPNLGVRMAFINQQQSASTLGALPPGVVVMEVESNRPVAKAGVAVGDVILTIAGRKIASEDELRQALRKIGPGKTEFSLRRGIDDAKTVTINCPDCKTE